MFFAGDGDEPLVHGTLTDAMSGISSLDRSGLATFEASLARLRSAVDAGAQLLVAGGELPALDAADLAAAGQADQPPPRTVVASLVLYGQAWDAVALLELGTKMADNPEGSRLLFLEPSAALGWRARFQRSRVFRRFIGRGERFDRDIPEELRAAGFMIGALDRFTLGPFGIRSYVCGEARPDRRALGLAEDHRSLL